MTEYRSPKNTARWIIWHTLCGPSLKVNLSLMKNVLKPFAKYVLIPLGLTSAASVQIQ